MAVSRALLVLLAVQTVLATSEPVHLSILRRSAPASPDTSYFARSAERLRARYRSREDFSSVKRATNASAGAEVPLVNQALDTEYLASVSIGTPPQKLTVLLDTASADLWVVSQQCGACSSSMPKFDYTKSSTFQFANGAQQPYVTLNFSSGAVRGSVAQDSVQMGGIGIDSQTLAVTNQTISAILGTNATGVMGLAFSTVSQTQATPFWQNLFNSNKLSQPVMSFWLTRYVNVTGARQYEYGGELTLGGTNTTLYTGNIEYQNLVNNPPDYWSLQLSSITLGGNAISITTPAVAIFDIGAKYIAGPSADVKTFWQAVPNSQPLVGGLAGYYSFPCDTQVQAAFSFGGSSWAVDPADINLGNLGSGQCLGAIHEMETILGNGNWVMGETFMKNVYSVFRITPPSLGFAQLSILNTQHQTSTTVSHSKLPIGPIVGGVGGAVVVFALLIAAIIMYNRKRAKNRIRVAQSSPVLKDRRGEPGTEKLITVDSNTYSVPGSMAQSIYELTPFVPSGPFPHPRDSWSRRSSQPTFTAPWAAGPSAPGRSTPDTPGSDRAEEYGVSSPVGMAYTTSAAAEAGSSSPLLPPPVFIATERRTSTMETISSGEASPTSPVAPPLPDQVQHRTSGYFGQQHVQRMADYAAAPRFQLSDPPSVEEYNIYSDYDRLMEDLEPSSSSHAPPPLPTKDRTDRI